MSRLARLHALSGLVVGAWLLFHAWEYGAALGGREEFSARFARTSRGAVAIVLEVLFGLLPLALHAGTGLVLAWRARGKTDAGHQQSAGLRRVMLASGVVLLVFVILHVAHLWARKVSGAIGTDGLHEVLMLELGMPFWLVVYCLGATAACLHLFYGALGALAAFAPDAREGQARALRIAGGIGAFLLWAHTINTIGRFAIGAGVFWGW